MVSLTSLWLPILLSAVAVFIVSSLVHMVFRWHRNDHMKLPAEDEIMAALARHNLQVGEYVFPHVGEPAMMKDPAFIEKRTRGPAGILSIMPYGMPPLAGFLAKWFVFSVLVTLFAAYLASRALGPGVESGEVFRFVATTAFMGYGMSSITESIWYNRPWSTTAKNLFDALLYAAVTGAIFVWMWPGG